MRIEKVGNCGCKLVRDDSGLHMDDCPMHAATPDLIAALRDIIAFLSAGGSADSMRETYQDIKTRQNSMIQNARAALQKAGVTL